MSLTTQANQLIPQLVQAGMSPQAAMAIATTIGNCQNSTTQTGQNIQNGTSTFNGPVIINNPDNTQGIVDEGTLLRDVSGGQRGLLQGQVNPAISFIAPTYLLSETQTLSSGSGATVAYINNDWLLTGAPGLGAPPPPPPNIQVCQLLGNFPAGGSTSGTLASGNTVTLVQGAITPWDPLVTGLTIPSGSYCLAMEDPTDPTGATWWPKFVDSNTVGNATANIAGGTTGNVSTLLGTVAASNEFVPITLQISSGAHVALMLDTFRNLYVIVAAVPCPVAISG